MNGEAITGFEDLNERLKRIEAVLKDQQTHEPSCPIRVAQKANQNSPGMYFRESGPCNCWLSKGE